MRALLAIIQRDLKLALRQGGGLGPALGFILAVMVLVPLAIGPDLNLLQRLAAGIMWLTLLLAVLLTAERIYAQDLEDGSLELFAISGQPMEAIVIAKTLAHWLSVSLPLAVIAPVLAVMLNLDTNQMPILWISMILGSLALSMLASLGGAITAGLKRGGLLVSILVLPLYVPVMIFGISAVSSSLGPAGATSSLLILFAITLLTCVLTPWAAAAALRMYLK
jgi:heme exporter protein B